MNMGILLLLAIIAIGSFAIGVVIVIGSLQMLRLKSRRWGMAASIMAILPCSPASLLGLVFGIWSLVVLNRPEVIAAFDVQSAAGPDPVRQ
jgi:hypothetical protein